MNITIRKSVFETNSSSTHSITIGKIRNEEDHGFTRPLVECGTLFPSRLVDYQKETGSSSRLVCRSVDKKAALVCSWVLDLKDNFYDGISEEDYEKCMAFLRSNLPYEDIVFEETWSNYSSSDECESYISSMSPMKSLEDLLEVIKDDEQEIIHSVQEN